MGERSGQDAENPNVLHTGDIVLLKVHLNETEKYAEATAEDTGYLRSDGFGDDLIVERVPSLQGDGVEIRDYLFTVIDQLSYAAQKDYQRKKKHLAQQLGDHAVGNVSAYKQLAVYEERAKQEAQQNFERIHSKFQKALSYGQVILLQHLRTQRFISVRAKIPATLQRVARKMELQHGCAASLLRINPFFRHKNQGDAVFLNEQVQIESAKLGNEWNLNWNRCRNSAKDEVYEVNFAKGGRGFYLELYSRATTVGTAVKERGMSFATPITVFNPHHNGYLCASTSSSKPLPFIRVATSKYDTARQNRSSKGVWIIEPASRGTNVFLEFSRTKVFLRHFSSGRYLAANEADIRDLGITPTGPRNFVQATAETGGDGLGAVLVSSPNQACQLIMEATHESGEEALGKTTMLVPPDTSNFMLKWHHQQKNRTWWLSVCNARKGKRQSMHVAFVSSKFSRDALRFEVVGNDPWMAECDVVAQHTTTLRKIITPRCKDFGNHFVAVTLCALCEQALTDMLLFVSTSPHWRAENPSNRPLDPLQVPWSASSQRQALLRELKYIDATFDLFHELVKQTPRLVESESRTLGHTALLSLTMQSLVQNSSLAELGDPSTEMLLALKTRCLKLIVRLWLYCFLGSDENEKYFCRNGWLDVINSLNGHGLGAADVFVALAGSRSSLARQIKQDTMQKFVDFIRLLGPLDTWLNFLKVVCAPQGIALCSKQQEVLATLIFPGQRSSAAERATAQRNRDVLLVAIRLGTPLGLPLGQPLRGVTPPPLEQCLARNLLVEGVRELAISWSSSEHWSHGQGTLYHGPAALGLSPVLSDQPLPAGARVWVSLAQVVWVLQPERCCEAATGQKWETVKPEFEEVWQRLARNKAVDTAAPSSASRIEHLMTLAKYFLAQLQLVDALVKEKQLNCVMALQEEYSFSVCICGASDPRLPTSIRTAFYNLITDLWVDRRPHVQVVVPALMRHLPEAGSVAHEALPAYNLREPCTPDVWSKDHLAALSAEAHDFYALGRPEKMEAITWSVRQYFSAGPDVEQQVHLAEEDNELMLSVLRLNLYLLRFGFISNLSLLRELMGPLLRCLDGRTDFVDPATKPGLDLLALQKRPEEDLPDPRTPLLPRVNAAASADDHPAVLIGARFPPLQDHNARYVECKEHNSVIQTKVRMLELISQLMQLSLNVKISRVLEVFREYQMEDQQRAPGYTDVADKLVKILDDPDVPMSWPHIRSPDAMLVDLLMYENSDLFRHSLKMLFGLHCQTAEVMEVLQKVELLTPVQVGLFEELIADVASIGQMIYAFEIWGVDDQFSSVDPSAFSKMQGVCNKLRGLCKTGAPQHSTSAYEVQKMLHETEFFSHVLYSVRSSPLDYHPNSRSLFRQVTSNLCGVAAYFVANNPKNQALAFQALSDVRELVAEDPESALLVAAIFRGNEELCGRVPEDLIAQFGELMTRDRRGGMFSPWYIIFFLAVSCVGVQPFTSNQMAIMEILQEGGSIMLHLLPGEDGYDRLKSLARRFKSGNQLIDPDVRSWTSGDDAELIYYAHSVDLLVQVARSHGTQTLLNKTYAVSMMSVPTLVQLLLTMELPERQTQGSNTGFSIYRHLRTRYLQLLHMVFYDVEKTHINEDFLVSAVHMELLRKFLSWAEMILQMPPLGGASDAPRRTILTGARLLNNSVNSDAHLLTAAEEEHLHAILDCVDDFLHGPHLHMMRQAIDHKTEVLDKLLEAYSVRFQWLGRNLQNQDSAMQLGVRDVGRLSITANRIVIATSPNAESTRVVKSKARGGDTQASSALETQWNAMMQAMSSSEVLRTRITEEQEKIGTLISSIAELTDPNASAYTSVLPERHGSLPEGVDFRRGMVTQEDVLKRFVRHCNDHLHGDVGTIELIQRTLHAMLTMAHRSKDTATLSYCQGTFVKTGIVGLIVKILDAQLTEEITNASWSLLALVMQGNDEAGLVNKVVQQGLYDVCVGGDDSGMWDTLSMQISNVCNEVKMARTLQRLDTHTEEELKQLEEYEEHVEVAVQAMEACRLMVEGHYFPMQQYLFCQVGNSRSCNVPEEVAKLLIRICKDPVAAELASKGELGCVSQSITVLTELAQGPNLRTQEFLASVGFVETVAKLLASDFDRQCRDADDLYPHFIRQLKAQLVEGLLSLLEGRSDSKNHSAIIDRLDTHMIKERIEFVYLYFVFGSATVSSGTLNLPDHIPAAVPLDHPVGSLVKSADEDASRVWGELAHSTAVAEELLEDLEDKQLNEFFGEGLRLVELFRILSPQSATFEKKVKPNETLLNWVDDRSQSSSENEHLEKRKAHYSERLYLSAFEFLSRFVKTIEVVLNGQLQSLHFQQSLTALWYVHGAAKENILETVPFSSPDVKMKTFVAMCSQLHGESRLIRDLSRFSIVPTRFLKHARRYLPDGAHRPFQVFLANDASWMQRLLTTQLFLGLTLASFMGIFLVPAPLPEEEKAVWVSPVAERAASSMGAVYLANTTLWVCLNVCIKVPLSLRRSPKGNPIWTVAETILQDHFLLWRAVLMLVSGYALLNQDGGWLYSFLLLDFFAQNATLSTVLKAVGTPMQSLLMTFLGTLIVTFVYAAVGFHAFIEDYGDYCSDNIMTCTVNILYQATRNSIIGLSSMMSLAMPGSTNWLWRVTYDSSYFIVFGIMILNTIVGLIVDSFSQLRTEAAARLQNQETQTFISCIDKQNIDTAATVNGINDGFQHHETHNQPKWDYMAFIFHLQEKSAQDYTGPEQTIRQMITHDDVSWLPIGRSKLLEQEEGSAWQDDILVRIEKHMEGLVRALNKSKEADALMMGQVSRLDRSFRDQVEHLLSAFSSVASKLTLAHDSTMASPSNMSLPPI